MGSPYLTKSDFKSCFDCATKLYYRKHAYPSNQDENEYLRFLAEGGFMIETVAKAKYPSQNDLVSERDPVRASNAPRRFSRLIRTRLSTRPPPFTDAIRRGSTYFAVRAIRWSSSK